MTTYEWSANECLDAWLKRAHKEISSSSNHSTNPIFDENEVTFSVLQEAYTTAAKAVAEHDEAYLPLFERLHNEIKEQQSKDELLSKAIEIAVDKS